MSRQLIDRDELEELMFSYYACVNRDTNKSNYQGETLMNYEVADLIEDCLDNATVIDAVSLEVWKQTAWERDIAIGQLEEHGITFGCIAPDVIKLPCKIGDTVWIARRYKCHKRPRKGVVSEMFFLDDMSLEIVVKSIGRGKWGVHVFGTCEEAQAAIDRGNKI